MNHQNREGNRMKAYGHSRTDKLQCKYGCCTYKSGKMLNCRKQVDRSNRKTARQEGIIAIRVSLKSALSDQ